jgi:hypothetical protein
VPIPGTTIDDSLIKSLFMLDPATNKKAGKEDQATRTKNTNAASDENEQLNEDDQDIDEEETFTEDQEFDEDAASEETDE